MIVRNPPTPDIRGDTRVALTADIRQHAPRAERESAVTEDSGVAVAVAPIAAAPGDRDILGHPRGLVVLAGTELWERISFHGMQALLGQGLDLSSH